MSTKGIKQEDVHTKEDFLAYCRTSHVLWRDFLKSGCDYNPKSTDVGSVEHHDWCIKWYDRLLEETP